MYKVSSSFHKFLTRNLVCSKNFSSILLKSATIVNSDETFLGSVLLKNGKISQIFRGNQVPIGFEKTEIIDLKNQYLIPGGIDPHTHFQLPFMNEFSIDDFNTGSRAAIAGGTTSFIDFVIPGPKESLLKAYDQWREWADPKVNCDYSLHVAITNWNDSIKKEMQEIVNRGVSSFKVFLAYKDALMLDDHDFLRVLERCKELGTICMVHAENGDLVAEAQKKLLALGITGPEGHYLSRPELFEANATNKAITFAEYINTPLYIVHVMSKDASEEIVKAKHRGNMLYSETLASALGADGSTLWSKDYKIAAGHVMSPPISPDPSTKTHLMRLLQVDALQLVSTDNCTFCNSQKKLGINNFTKIPNGVNGIEDRMSVVWTKGVKTGLLSPSDFVRITSTSAAKIFNLYPKKGIIREGADADLIVWNGDKERVISYKNHHQKVDFNIFEGMTVKGVNEMTIVKGKIVWKNGDFTSELSKGEGKFIERKPFGYAFERLEELEKAKDPRNFKVERNTDINVNINSNDEISILKQEILKLKEENSQLKSSQIDLNNCLDSNNNLTNIDDIINTLPKSKQLDEFKRIFYGPSIESSYPIDPKSIDLSQKHNFEIKGYKISAEIEQLRSPKIVRIGAIQHSIVLPTTAPVQDQALAIRKKMEILIEAAYHSGANIICLPECWTCPFFMCTREKSPWLEFAESPTNGESTQLLKRLAKKYNMVIISSILELDDSKEICWNAAVVIDNQGEILGKMHKNHIPRVGDFNESTYYMEGQLGNPVFETDFGKIGINICYGRHHPLHWQALGLNGADIVFNPSATVHGLSEHLWFIEARNAAIANNYFSVGINRVGTEVFPYLFSSGDGKEPKKEFGHFYGSSHITAPNGARTPALSRVRDGVLILEADLNLNRQIKQKWGFQMTARTEMYAELLGRYSKDNFEKQIVRKNK